MKRLAKACALIALPACLAAHAGGNVSATLGARFLDDDKEPVDTQFMFGLMGDVQLGSTPLYVEWALRGSGDEGRETISGTRTTITAAIVDLSTGLLFKPDQGRVRPYFSAGVASVGFSVEEDTRGSFGTSGSRAEDDDQSFGFYVASGVLFRIGRSFDLGLDARYLGGTDFTLFNEEDPSGRGVDTDVDSFTIGMRAGYSWGGSDTDSTGAAKASEPVPITPAPVAPVNDRAAAALQACNRILQRNQFKTSCEFSYAADQTPTLTAQLPSMGDIRTNNSTISAQVVDPFCAATRQGPKTGVVSVQIPATRQKLDYNCGLGAWGTWSSQ